MGAKRPKSLGIYIIITLCFQITWDDLRTVLTSIQINSCSFLFTDLGLIKKRRLVIPRRGNSISVARTAFRNQKEQIYLIIIFSYLEFFIFMVLTSRGFVHFFLNIFLFSSGGGNFMCVCLYQKSVCKVYRTEGVYCRYIQYIRISEFVHSRSVHLFIVNCLLKK